MERPQLGGHAAYELLDQTVARPATATDTTITITAFFGVVKDSIGRRDFPAGSVTGLSPSTAHVVSTP